MLEEGRVPHQIGLGKLRRHRWRRHGAARKSGGMRGTGAAAAARPKLVEVKRLRGAVKDAAGWRGDGAELLLRRLVHQPARLRLAEVEEAAARGHVAALHAVAARPAARSAAHGCWAAAGAAVPLLQPACESFIVAHLHLKLLLLQRLSEGLITRCCCHRPVQRRLRLLLLMLPLLKANDCQGLFGVTAGPCQRLARPLPATSTVVHQTLNHNLGARRSRSSRRHLWLGLVFFSVAAV